MDYPCVRVTWPNFLILRPPLITFEGIEISDSNLEQTSRMHPSGVRTIKWPLNGHGLDHVTEFRNSGTPYNFWTNRDIGFKFGTDIDHGPLLRPDHKPKLGVAWITWPNFEILGPPYNFGTNRDICFKFDIAGRTPTASGPQSDP